MRPVSQHLFLIIICGTLKNRWHCSKRVGRGVPGVMVYLIRAFIGLGGWGEIIYAARGAFYMLTSPKGSGQLQLQLQLLSEVLHFSYDYCKFGANGKNTSV